MKKILILLLITVAGYGQTYQNPTYGTLTLKTNVESATATKINAQETDGKINWLQPINIPIPLTPTSYAPVTATLGGHLTGINNKFASITATTAGISTRVWWTADISVVDGDNYYATNPLGKGTLASAIQTVSNDDNQKKWYTQDLIGAAFASDVLFPPGTYAGNLSASTTPNSAQQRWTVELYKCDNLGNPIASGVTGAVVGDLGVTTITILDSGLLTLADGSVTNVQVSGSVGAGGLSMLTGQRIRYHVSAEKVGTTGNFIDQKVYYGTSYNSFLDVPVIFDTNSVLNKSTVIGTTATEALNTLNTALGANGIATVYVETNGNDATAEVGNSRKTYLTIDAALDDLPADGGVIKIGVGSFLSPTPSKIKSGVKFLGSGKPVTNSTITYTGSATKPTITSPTKLVGGTILLGKVEVVQKDNIEFHNLGVDSGLDYCNTYKAGVAQEGLIFAQEYNPLGGLPSADGFHQLQSNSPPRVGIVVNNVSSLCKTASSPVHAMLIENTLNAKISNVSTYYGTHGLVIKSIGCEVNGLDAHGHTSNGLIFKSNDYAYGVKNSATNIYITSIVGYDGGGINFVTEQPAFVNSFTTLSNFNIEFTTYGIKNSGETEGNAISNGIIFTTTGNGIDVNSLFINSSFSNIDQRSSSTGFLVNQNNALGVGIRLSNISTGNNSVRGYNLTAISSSNIFLSNCSGSNTTGSILSGNIYGFLKEQGAGTISGTFKYENATSSDFISALNANGILTKTAVPVSELVVYSQLEPKITITTSISITTATLDANGIRQDGRHVVIDNGVNAINLTCNGGVTTSYGKVGTGAITFVQGSGRTLVQLTGTAILNGIAGSEAKLWSNGTTDYLTIINY